MPVIRCTDHESSTAGGSPGVVHILADAPWARTAGTHHPRDVTRTSPTRTSPTSPARPLAALAALLLGLLALGASAAEAYDEPPTADPVGVWPLRPEPEVVVDFDPPTSPYGAGHRGVDLAGSSGQWVVSALPGTVTYAAPLAGRGVVVVAHGITRTTYQPVTATVSVGDQVGAGDRIGRLALPGSHCAPRACLHWGWVEGETYLDPLRLVGAVPVRLLPLWRDLPLDSPGPMTTPDVLPSLRLSGWRPVLAAGAD